MQPHGSESAYFAELCDSLSTTGVTSPKKNKRVGFGQKQKKIARSMEHRKRQQERQDPGGGSGEPPRGGVGGSSHNVSEHVSGGHASEHQELEEAAQRSPINSTVSDLGHQRRPEERHAESEAKALAKMVLASQGVLERKCEAEESRRKAAERRLKEDREALYWFQRGESDGLQERIAAIENDKHNPGRRCGVE